jgi:hypothetical protein
VLQRALLGVHSVSGMAGAYGTAFWASAGLAAMAIVPCIVLLRAERAARAAHRADERAAADAAVEAAAA